jgi:hypothetical protein
LAAKTKWIVMAVLFLALNTADPCAAQSMASKRSVLTNRDIVTLAKAGFDEDFVIDAIARSRKEFDTSADALAALAGEGITQRIVRAILDSETSAPKPEATRAEAAPQTTQPPQPQPAAPEPSPKASAKASSKKQPRPAPISMAISGNISYSESSSMFWGLMQKKVGVGSAATRPEDAMPLHMGTAFAGVLASSGKAR